MKLIIISPKVVQHGYLRYNSNEYTNIYRSGGKKVMSFMLKMFAYQDLSKLIGRGLYLRVRNENLIFLILNQNVCCGYSKEPSQ